ncbi:acyltransferase [Vibrio fluvialis]|nr:acyltransferase [Vibrio fluvialis]
MQKRLYQYDMLRGFAALFVCLYHFLYIYPSQYGTYSESNVFQFGKYGVEIFFILSGFVISFSIRKFKFRQFLTSRFIRIYPQYVICMSMTTVICYLYGERTIEPSDFISNIFILSHPLGFDSIDGVYWSLSYEISFYAIISFIYYYTYIKKGLRFNFVILSILMMSTQIFILAINKFFLNGGLEVLVKLLSLRFLHLFMIGYIISVYVDKGKVDNTLIAAITICFITQVVIDKNSIIPVIVCTFLMIGLLFIEIKSHRIIQVAKYLAALSYPFYLIHQFIGYEFIDKTYDKLGFISIPLGFISVILLSVLALSLNNILLSKVILSSEIIKS